MTNSDYSYEILDNEEDARTCAQLLAEEFTTHNPITRFDQISTKQFFDECSWPHIHSVYQERLSFLARHRSTGEIVAATIATDLYQQHKPDLSINGHVSSIPIDTLLEEMDELFIQRDFGQDLTKNLVLHITLSAVRHAHSGQNISSQMSERLCEHAHRERGFSYALVQVTNPATRHIYAKKLGGKEVTLIDPTTWIWKKNEHESLCPYKDYRGGTIPNILLKLEMQRP